MLIAANKARSIKFLVLNFMFINFLLFRKKHYTKEKVFLNAVVDATLYRKQNCFSFIGNIPSYDTLRMILTLLIKITI